MDNMDITTKRCELVLEQHVKNRPLVPAIDVHTHFGRLILGDAYVGMYNTHDVVRNLKGCGITKVVNLDGEYGAHFDRMLRKTEGFEDFFITFGSVDLTRFEQASFEFEVRKEIERQVSLGMRGLKFWKILGLSVKDKHGAYLRIDDERLSVIWHTAAEYGLPVLIHIADPTAFFRPVNEQNERIEELRVHPDWSFYGRGHYTFAQLMEMQEHLLEKNPKTTFIVAHCGSHAENLAKVGRWLDRYENMYIDIAERINELGRQPYTARQFVTRYATRVLFGTDLNPLHTAHYAINYRFLETWDEYFDYSTQNPPPQGIWKICGIGLEPDVLRKIYHDNAAKMFGLLQEEAIP